MRTGAQEIIEAFRSVFSSTSRIVLVPVLSAVLYILVMLGGNFSYIRSLVSFSLPVSAKLELLSVFITSPLSLFSPSSFALTLLAIVLFAIQLVMLNYFLKIRKTGVESGSIILSGSGTFLALLGIGCASCGSIVFTTIAAASGVAIQNYLPFGGEELSIFAVVLLALSIYRLAKKINAPFVC